MYEMLWSNHVMDHDQIKYIKEDAMGSATNSISAAMNFMAGGTAASNVSAVTMPE